MPAGGGGEDVTLGEVARNLERLAQQMDSGFSRVDERFNNLAMVHSDVYIADRRADADRHKTLADRVEKLEEQKQWLWRAFGGSLVAAVVGAIVAAGGWPH